MFFLINNKKIMLVKIYWEEKNTKELLNKVTCILEELWLNDFIKVKTTIDTKLKEELNITKEPALIVEEESIDFKDTIFEWIVPEDEELKAMFISIIGWWKGSDWCAPSSCSSCSGC